MKQKVAVVLGLVMLTAVACKQAATASQAKEDAPGGTTDAKTAKAGASAAALADAGEAAAPAIAKADATPECITRIQSSTSCSIVPNTQKWLTDETSQCGHIESSDGTKLEVFIGRDGSLVAVGWAGADASDAICPAMIGKADLNGSLVIAGNSAFMMTTGGGLIFMTGDGTVFEMLDDAGASLKLASIAKDPAKPDALSMTTVDGQTSSKPVSYFADRARGSQGRTVSFTSRKSSMLGQDMQQ